MASVCSTHNSMLSYLETAINDIHVNLMKIDTEVSQNLSQGHSPQSALWTCWTPQFFKEPSKESCNPTIPLDGSHDETVCSNCLVELPRILFTVKKEVDRHVQYVDFIQEKMNAVSMSTAKANLTPKSHANLNRNASVRRSNIRTNPSFPVLHSQKSHGALLTNQNSFVPNAESFKHSLTLESQPCVCCEKCSSVLHLFSQTVCSRVNYLKDQCQELKIRLVKELLEKERELNMWLSQIKTAKENVGSSFCHLENLGQQCLVIFTNLQDKDDMDSKQKDNCDGNQFDIRSAADGQSCDKEITNQNLGLLLDSSESTNKNTRLPSSSSEGSYTLPVGLSHDEDYSVITMSADDKDRICIYDELVFSTQNEQQEAESKQSHDISVSCDNDKSPLPELIEFQRKRSDSLNRYDKLFQREDFRRRSQSNPVSFKTRKAMNASGPYYTIQEGTDDSLNQDGPSTELHHAKSECVINEPDTKQRKIKKSKSSIMVRATKIKNFITKKFKRKSLGGKPQKKSTSSSSVQASSTGVQFFEYDFSDDGIDKSLNATSDRLGDLSFLTGMSNNLDNSMFDMDFSGHKLDFSGQNLDYSGNNSSEDETEPFHTSETNYNHWFNKQIASIERLLNDTTGGEDMPDQLTEDQSSQLSVNPRNRSPHTQDHIQMVLPLKLRTHTNLYYNDLAMERAPLESLSAISCIEPVDHITNIVNDTMDNSLFEEAEERVSGLSQTSYRSESQKCEVFDAERKVSSSSDNSISFNDNRGFDVNHGYGTSNIFRNRNNMTDPFLAEHTINSFPIPSDQDLMCRTSLDHREFIDPLRFHQLESHHNMEKLWHLKPYLLQGTLTGTFLVNLINNYPHNFLEVPGYNSVTKEISMELVSNVFSQSSKPHIFARDLVWHLFTLLELYGGKSKSGKNTDSLDNDLIVAIRNATVHQYHITTQIWQYQCVSFIHQSINDLFNQKLRLPVFRALFQQSDC